MSMIYVDEIIQSFLNDGNVFLRLGVVTGDVDGAGKDIKETPVTLVIPLSRFSMFAKNAGIAAELYLPSHQDPLSPASKEAAAVELGLPLAVPD